MRNRKQDLSIPRPGKQQCCLWGAWGHRTAVSSASSAGTAFIHFISDRFWIFLITREKRRGGEVGREREKRLWWEARKSHLWFQWKFTFSYPWLKKASGGKLARQLAPSASSETTPLEYVPVYAFPDKHYRNEAVTGRKRRWFPA